MSEVHRYQVVKMLSEVGNVISYTPHGPWVVMADAHDRELAALREELAEYQKVLSYSGNEADAHSTAALHTELEDTQRRLSGAEQRNASLLEIARGLTIQLHATIGNTELHDDCVRDLAELEAVDAKD